MSTEPLFWYRPRTDGGYEGPLHNGQIEDVRKASGAWVPLFAGAAPAAPVETPAPAFSVGVHGVGVIDDNPSALAVYFNAAPNNDDIRALHEIVTNAPVAAQVQQPVSGADGLPTERVLIDGTAYELPAAVAAELLRLHLEILGSEQAQLSGNPGQLEPSGNSGELPDLSIQWHDTPEEAHRIFWEKAAIENGLIYEELIEGAMVGETEHREKVDLTYGQEIQAIRDQKCWGCADTETNQIHAWAAPDVDRTLLIHMLAHEIGHLTGEPLPDDIQEELRAETFGKVAAMAYQMLQAQQDVDTVDAERYRAWRDALITGKTAEDDFIRLVADNLPTSVGVSRRPTAAEWDAAIDAARKEQA